MSTQAASAAGGGARTVVTVAATDTYISSALTEPVTAKLPAGSSMTDGDAIRFECTGGSLMVIETNSGRTVGVVPGDGQAVCVYEPGDTNDDFWRFVLLANQPQTTVANASAQAAVTATADAITASLGAMTAASLQDYEIMVNADMAESATDAKFKSTATCYYRIDGIQYTKAAQDDLVFSAADTINTAAAAGQYWGIWLIQLNAAGTFSTKSPSSDQVYASEAAAIAALPSPDAGNAAVGYLTIQSNTDVAFTCNTDDLTDDAAGFTFYETTETDLVDDQIDALVVDVTAIKAAVDALIVDVTALKATADALIVDVGAGKTAVDAVVTKTNSVLSTLEKFGFHKAE